MSVPIRENWTDLTGVLLDVNPSATREGFIELDVLVDGAHAVTGYPNMLEGAVGTRLRVGYRTDEPGPESALRGRRVTLRVRRGQTPDQLFARTGSLEPLSG